MFSTYRRRCLKIIKKIYYKVCLLYCINFIIDTIHVLVGFLVFYAAQTASWLISGAETSTTSSFFVSSFDWYRFHCDPLSINEEMWIIVQHTCIHPKISKGHHHRVFWLDESLRLPSPYSVLISHYELSGLRPSTFDFGTRYTRDFGPH